MVGTRGGSDLGRRLTQRREELDLSIELVAAGASMDPGYLTYLETATDPDPSRGTLWRLAAVLRTSPESLRGGDQGRPPGRCPPGPEPRLEEMAREDCFVLLAPGGIGRFVFIEGRGPVAVPVNSMRPWPKAGACCFPELLTGSRTPPSRPRSRLWGSSRGRVGCGTPTTGSGPKR